MRNLHINNGIPCPNKQVNEVHYVSVLEKDYKVESLEEGGYNVTDISSGKTTKLNASDFQLDYGAILRY